MILNMVRTVGGMRAIAEGVLLPVQLAARQIGLTAAITFPGIPSGDKYHAGVPNLLESSDAEASVLGMLTAFSGDCASQLMTTAILVAQVIYRCVLPESFLYLSYGDTSAEANYPWPNTTNIGECFGSVHAAQIVDNMLRDAAVGLAGIPNKMNQLAQELTLELNGGTEFTVHGESSSSITGGGAIALPGVHMIGHAAILMRDSRLANGDTFSVEVSTFRESSPGSESQIRSRGVPIVVQNRLAFTSNTTAARGYRDNNVENRTIALYADFDLQRFSDLRLTLPNTHTTNAYAYNPGARSMVPGFVAGAIENGFASVTGNVGLRLIQREPKRPRLDYAANNNTEAPRRDSEQGGSDTRSGRGGTGDGQMARRGDAGDSGHGADAAGES